MIVHSPESRANDAAFKFCAANFGDNWQNWNEWNWGQYYKVYKAFLAEERREINEYRRDEHEGNCL